MVRAAAMRMRPSAEGPVLAPPCMRQRPFFIAGLLQGQPARVFAPHRGAAFGLPRGLPLRSVPTGVTGAASGCVGLCAQSSIGGGRTGFRAPSGGAMACGTVPRHRSLNGEPWAAKTNPEVRHDECFNARHRIMKVFTSPAIHVRVTGQWMEARMAAASGGVRLSVA